MKIKKQDVTAQKDRFEDKIERREKIDWDLIKRTEQLIKEGKQSVLFGNRHRQIQMMVPQ